MKYLQRTAERSLLEMTKRHPVVVLTGARQTGKTTLLDHLFEDEKWRRISLDDLDSLELAMEAPEDLLAGAEKVIIDEVQKAPKLLSVVKRAVDRNRKAARFVLSGSANMTLMSEVSETLAGRAVYLNLFPMSFGELSGTKEKGFLGQLFDEEFATEFLTWVSTAKKIPARAGGSTWKNRMDRLLLSGHRLSPARLREAIWRGGFPAILGADADTITEWFEGYEKTYLERDVMQFSQISEIIPFRRTIRTAASQSGGLLNLASFGRDVGVAAPTVRNYLDLLQVSMLGGQLPPYYASRRKRLIKTPKFYLQDSGLTSHLCGIHTVGQMSSSPMLPALLETWVLQQLVTASELLKPAAQVFYWRTTDGKEVDFLVEQANRLIGIEVKSTDKPRPTKLQGLKALRGEQPDAFAMGLVVHTGDDFFPLGERLVAVPASALSTL